MNTGYSKLDDTNQQSAVDLRTEAEKILQRAQQLAEPDRTLVTMYLKNTNSFRQISRLTGIGSVTVARRIRKIIETLRDEKLNAMLTSGKLLGRREKKIVRDYFFGGLTIGNIARKHRISYYNAGKIISFVRKITQQGRGTTTVRNY